MRYHDDRHTLIAVQAHHDVEHLRPAVWIEHARRLVEYHQLGLYREHAGNGDALFLSARQPKRSARRILAHTDARQRPIDAGAYLVGRKPEVFRTESDVVLYHRRHHLIIGVLKNDSDLLAYLEKFLVLGRLAVDGHAAAVGHEQSVAKPRERRLARAVTPDQRDELAALDGKAYRLQRLYIFVVAALIRVVDVLEFQKRHD